MLSSKERVKRAINLEMPDIVPVDFWATKEVKEGLLKYFGFQRQEELLRELEVDLRYIEGVKYIGPPLKEYPDGSVEDVWGVRRLKKSYGDDAIYGTYEHVVFPPLANAETVHDIENYHHWPSADWYDYSGIGEEAAAYSDYAIVLAASRTNRAAQLKPAMYLRGIDQILIDLINSPILVEALLEKIVDFYISHYERIFKAGGKYIDIFFMGDDFGMQSSMFMSIEMWRRFFKPGFCRFIELAHRYNIKVMHHTCGAVEPLIPEFIDSGLDILQSLQPRAAGMEKDKLKKKYGKYIAFHGGIDIQETLPHGRPEDVKREVKEAISILGDGGGYILATAHNIQNDTPLENILALYEAAKEYR